jgi:site-specific DNA-adenine methylase
MSLKPFFTYYGGKFRIAPKYPRPVFSTIIEPFCGSAGYSLRHYKNQIKLYDLNERIVGTWKYLINVSEQEIIALPEIFDDVRDLNISQEAKWLIGYWCNKGSCEPRNKPSTWMKSGVRPNSQWGRVIKQRIASQLKFIRHWTCDLKDYKNIEHKEDATWFIDPPYSAIAGRLYTYSKIDYKRLSDWCLSRQGQTIVCEMQGASWLPFEKFYTAKGLEGPKGKKKIKEVIWINK